METVEGTFIEEQEINQSSGNNSNETPPNKNKECKACKKGLNTSHILIMILAFYMLFAAVYGTIKLIKDFLLFLGY
jgi:hypothetical protein